MVCGFAWCFRTYGVTCLVHVGATEARRILRDMGLCTPYRAARGSPATTSPRLLVHVVMPHIAGSRFLKQEGQLSLRSFSMILSRSITGRAGAY